MPNESVRPERSEPARASEVEGRSTESSTRFLGDLYQDLSESVRERYALLQTPDFVERFILGLTLDPAIQEFGLEEVRVIDPTCGSGHFLLGAYDRLFEARLAARPGLDRREHALAALQQVYGADINPYAVAIARFRLTLAFLEKAGLTRLADAPKLPSNLVVADSLLYGARGANREFSELAASKKEWGDTLFTLEEPDRALEVLSRGYHVVVGNPPYITCKDAKLRDKYRALYPNSAAGKYALAAPFAERFFNLGVEAGFVGLINANSFMKREFGKKLIESVLPNLDLTHVIDTSGAYIPGHGTPTVILVGRNRGPVSDKVRAVLGKRGEPETPTDPEHGKVWSSIADHLGVVGFENEYVSIAEVDRATFEKHPWSLGGGGAAELKELLEVRCEKRLGDLAQSIGITCFTLEDDAYTAPRHCLARAGVEDEYIRQMIEGEYVRDWAQNEGNCTVFPYEQDFSPSRSTATRALRYLWPYRTNLSNSYLFGGKTKVQGGLSWFEFGRLTSEKLRTPLSIAFAEVATHNHFVLDRGGKVFKQTAPIIKLPEGVTEEDHLALVGYLNSSAACFWMKQVCHKKSSASQKHHSDPARAAYAFSGTALSKMPIPALSGFPTEAVRRLLDLCETRSDILSGRVLFRAVGDARSGADVQTLLGNAWRALDAVTGEAAYLQEELDWWCYARLGFCSDEEAAISIVEADAPLGARPFEFDAGYDPVVSDRIHGARRVVQDSAVPEHWRARRDLLDRDGIRLVESREFKRQWRDTELNIEQGKFRLELARSSLDEFAMAVLEQELTTSPGCLSLRDLCQRAALKAPACLAIAEYYETDWPQLCAQLVAAESVPYLSALYVTSEAQDEVRAAWERTWDLQRREDAGEEVGEIPVPPKYDQKDYRDPVYWRVRGKLDVPKERFISYPGAERDDDKSPLIGWAGWDHLQRAQALAAVYQERKNQDGWEKERLRPLLAGLLELVPWLKQWHNAPDEDPAKDRAGDAYASFVETEALGLGYTIDDLRAWRPEERRGRNPLALRQAQGERNGRRAQGKRAGADGAADEGAVAEPVAPKKPRKRKSTSKEAAE